MNPLAANPEPPSLAPTRSTPNPLPQRNHNPLPQPQQSTLWGFITKHLPLQGPPQAQLPPAPTLYPDNLQPELATATTPLSTPLPRPASPQSQPRTHRPTPQQRML